MGFLYAPKGPHDEVVTSDRQELNLTDQDIFGLDELAWELKKDSFLTELMNKREGYYSNHPKDSGGKTIWGLTTETYGKAYIDRMEKMDKQGSQDIARKVYQKDYLDEAEELFGRTDTALKFADISINTGRKNALSILQSAFNSLLPETHQIKEDGALGEDTKKAISNVTSLYSSAEIQNAFKQSQMEYYRKLPNAEKFGGWRRRALYDPSK